MKQRIEELDGLRGIAALLVVFFHYFLRYDNLYEHKGLYTYWSIFGKLGIELFFMISGFVIFWSTNNLKSSRDFLISRFARLYPAYWTAIIITFLIVTLLGLPGREVSIGKFLGNFLMFHGYFNIPDVDGVYWTLKIELTFYLWILVLFFLNLIQHINFFILGTLIFILAIYSFPLFEIPKIVEELLFMKWFAFFSIGISLFQIINRKLSLILYINLFLALLNTIFIHSLKNFFIYCLITSILFLAIKGYKKFLKHRVFLFFGSISYVLYLLHQNIGYVLINYGYKYQIHPLFSIIIALTVSLCLSYFIHTLIERPVGKKIKNWYGYYSKKRILIKN